MWQHWLWHTKKQTVSAVTPLTGLTACSQRVDTISGQRYVLRSQTPRATDFGINYQQEALFLKQLAPLNLAPELYYHDHQYCLLGWIEGTTPSAFTPQLLEQLATKLAQLHQFSLNNFPAQHSLHLNLADRCQFLWDKLPAEKQKTLGFAPPFQTITPLREALCHHDIHLANLVLCENQLYLIDWEYAAISDIALELAMLRHSQIFNETQWACFLEHYITKIGLDLPACTQKIAEYLPEVAKLSQLWYALR